MDPRSAAILRVQNVLAKHPASCLLVHVMDPQESIMIIFLIILGLACSLTLLPTPGETLNMIMFIIIIEIIIM